MPRSTRSAAALSVPPAEPIVTVKVSSTGALLPFRCCCFFCFFWLLLAVLAAACCCSGLPCFSLRFVLAIASARDRRCSMRSLSPLLAPFFFMFAISSAAAAAYASSASLMRPFASNSAAFLSAKSVDPPPPPPPPPPIPLSAILAKLLFRTTFSAPPFFPSLFTLLPAT